MKSETKKKRLILHKVLHDANRPVLKHEFSIIRSPRLAYNENKDAEAAACCKQVVIVTELFNSIVNDLDVKKSVLAVFLFYPNLRQLGPSKVSRKQLIGSIEGDCNAFSYNEEFTASK